MRIEHMTWPQAKRYFETSDTVVISVGSIENHGTHGALGTDYLVPDRLIDMICKDLDVLCTPVMPFGQADHHMGYPGTISLGHDGLYTVMKAVAESMYAHGARKIIFLNGHGGNTPVLARVGADMRKLGCICAELDWWLIAHKLNNNWLGGHGGAQETSAVMAINPDYVDLDAILDTNLTPLSDTLPSDGIGTVLFKGVSVPVQRGMHEVSSSGWSGPDHPKNASIKWGNEMLTGVSEFIIDFITEFKKVVI
ncbi:MAG: creatininase family protein [Clostridiales bacterium]|jgi:creatinine amidohydrolase|nr:creatininase family protein [Clostridiales bacterium]